MKQAIIQHPTGVHFHVEYIPRTKHSKPRIADVRLAGADYEPIGPNLATFLHEVYTLQKVQGTDTQDAVPVLQGIIEEVESYE
jgi:hypothetical protein